MQNKRKATMLKDLNIEFQNFKYFQMYGGEGKKLVYFVSKDFKLHGSASPDEINDEG